MCVGGGAQPDQQQHWGERDYASGLGGWWGWGCTSVGVTGEWEAKDVQEVGGGVVEGLECCHKMRCRLHRTSVRTSLTHGNVCLEKRSGMQINE